MKSMRSQAAVVFLALIGVLLPTERPSAQSAGSSETVTEVVVESDDTRALVAPIALYPDPILALILQSSTLPLEVVQADRFLGKRAKDASLQPDPDWDKSIIGLLNYPRQVQLMSEYIDWTEELGNTVIDDLDEVQSSIQDIRLAAYYAGFLESNERQKVTVDRDVVRITSTDPDKVSIPQYDPAALLTALDEVEEIEEVEAAAAEEAVAPAPAPKSAAAPAAPAQTSAPATAPTAAPAETAVVASVAEPVTPPVIAYSEPENSFWQSAATFGGGAVVGGLLGWGLTEAFDDDDDDIDIDWDNDRIQDELRDRRDFREDRREDVLQAREDRREDVLQAREDRRGDRQATREDVVQARADRREDVKETRQDRAARAREQLNERPAARGGKAGPSAGKPVKKAQVKRERAKRDVKLPGGGKQAGVADKVRKRDAAARPAKATGKPATGKPAPAKLASAKQKRAQTQAGRAPKRDGKGIAASTGNPRQVKKEANRGARSRGVAKGGGQRRTTPASVSRGGGGGGGIAASQARGSRAKQDGARGRASRGGDGGGRGGGRGGGKGGRHR